MNDPFDDLISAYLDETLSEQQLPELEQWINADPEHARRFADAVYLEERLTAELKLKNFTDSEPLETEVVAMPMARRGYFGMRGVAAMAACLALVAGLAFWWQANTTPGGDAGFAAVARSIEANWAEGHALSDGERISSRLIQLEAGIVHLQFDSGVEVTLQGPAVYELTSPDVTRLHSGVLTCSVPTGAEGFRVDTRTAQVIDLGTAFGIEQPDHGPTVVSVFDGEVEIVTGKARDEHLLTEGKTMQLGSDGSISEVPFASDPFEKLWPAASGIAGSTGDFRFAPQWPRRLRLIESDTDIFVAPEGYAKVLEVPCPVDISESALIDSRIPTGRRVRSFLLQFNPREQDANNTGNGGGRGKGRGKRISGSITFARPVLGLMIDSDTLEKTDDMFSLRSGRVPSARRGLELSPPALADVVSISEDRRTVTLELVVFDRFSDHVRVIVDAALGDDGKDQ